MGLLLWGLCSFGLSGSLFSSGLHWRDWVWSLLSSRVVACGGTCLFAVQLGNASEHFPEVAKTSHSCSLHSLSTPVHEAPSRTLDLEHYLDTLA